MKEKAIYETMNLSKQQASGYSIDCWIPTKKCEEVMETINMRNLDKNRNKEIMGGQIKPHENSEEKPPTYFKLNKFTAVFQLIVNIYGVPRYKEINPGLFTIVTFPFLFAVMFGDMFHGSLLLLFALYLTFGYNYILKTKGALVDVLPFRYLLLMMGCFAVFTGTIYNDFTSLQLNLFGSCYDIHDNVNGVIMKTPTCTYPFGIDPIWSISTEEIAYSNSLKMKMAVILGVSQMVMGICLKGANAVYFRKPLEFIFEFIP